MGKKDDHAEETRVRKRKTSSNRSPEPKNHNHCDSKDKNRDRSSSSSGGNDSKKTSLGCHRDGESKSVSVTASPSGRHSTACVPLSHGEWLRPFRVAGVVCAVVMATLWILPLADNSHEFPCQCVAMAGPLASALASARYGFTGLHVHQVDRAKLEHEATALSTCVKLHRLTTSFDSVEALSQRLRRDASDGMCHAWIVNDVAVVQRVANSLKELLEDNALRGEKVLREDARGMFVLASTRNREQLKEILPHRVVHMFRTIKV